MVEEGAHDKLLFILILIYVFSLAAAFCGAKTFLLRVSRCEGQGHS